MPLASYLSRHAETLDDAVAIAKAVQLLGGRANLYDMTAATRPHWLVEIFNLPEHDWTAEEQEAVA